MDIKNDHDRLDFVAGRVHGINAVLLALAKTHPDPATFLHEIESVEQAALAKVEPTLMTDLYLDGMRDIIDRVQNYLRQRLEDASHHDTD
jgi:hypothetical protein